MRVVSILRSDELVDLAFRHASSIKDVHNFRIKKGDSPRLARRKAISLAKVQSVRDYLYTRLEKYERRYPSLERLHPLHRELLESYHPIEKVKKSLYHVKWARNTIDRVARDITRKIMDSRRLEDPNRYRKQFYARVQSIMDSISSDLDLLIEVRGIVQSFPDLNPEWPVVAIAGGPNVGKSSLVKAISTARVEIAEYPFTTKSVSLGHFEVNGMRIQVMDTPGLLDRTEEEQNEIERRATAVLKHSADLVVFVFDPSESCGMPMERQRKVYDYVRSIFPEDRIITVASKVDLFASDVEGEYDILVSPISGRGIEELRQKIVDALSK